MTIDDFIQKILLPLVPALIIAIVTAILTVQLSLGRFRSERWWEKKAETYSNIIGHLSKLLYYISIWMDWERAEIEGTSTLEIPKERQTRLSDGYREALEELKLVKAGGAYIISRDADTALDRVVRDLESDKENWSYWDRLNADYIAIRDGIKRIRAYAHKDLGVERLAPYMEQVEQLLQMGKNKKVTKKG